MTFVVIQTAPQFCFVILFASFLWGWGASLISMLADWL
jgi:hypothetical protein